MTLDAVQHRFGLIEEIPPSADLHIASTPFLPAPRSASPIRRQRSPQHELDSYLSDLEPSLVLEALFAKTGAPTTLTQQDEGEKQARQAFIRNAVAGASPSEREWGIKAAKASKSIREWYDELASWPWPKPGQPNGYGAQYNEDQLAKTVSPHTRERNRSTIPSSEIRAYEMRMEDIKRNLDLLELGDLKGHVRDVHVTPNSKSTLQESSPETANYETMDDFQAIITAAILQSFPTLARLNALMNVWSLRLVVMRLIPEFMQNMASCKDSMISAQMAVGGLTSPTPISSPRGSTTSSQRKSFSRSVFDDMQAVLKDQISETGKKLDAMLDLLEDSVDVLPEQWIDSMDELEEQQNLWAEQAEKIVQDHEIDLLNPKPSGTEQADSELHGHGLQLSKNTSRDSRAYSSPTGEFDHQALSTSTTPWAAMSTSDVSDLSISHIITAPLVRNVSVGVRKPTGVPEISNQELAKLTSGAEQEKSFDRQEAFNVESNRTSDLVSPRSRSGSVDSDNFSIGSSPEIQNATLAAYPGSPVQVTTPGSRRPSVDHLNISQYSDLNNARSRKSWSGAPSDSRLPKHQRRRSSTFTASASPSPGPNSYLQPGDAILAFGSDHARPRSASIKSFEVVPRNEVRTIEIRRNRDSSQSLQHIVHEGRPPSLTSRVEHLQNSVSNSSGSSLEASLLNLTMAQDRFTPDDIGQKSPSVSVSESPKIDLVQLTIGKTRKPSEKGPVSTSRIPRVALRHRAATMNDGSTVKASGSPQLDDADRLDARISTILTKIPADIRLTSSIDATTPAQNIENSVFTKSRTSHLSRLSVSRLLRPKASISNTPPTTLTRAATSFSSEPRSNGTSDIKLYHLHQPGSLSPIKLYVRLVGDTGERVMVRVGGGWADLAEYLREYASHHGKRAVSDNHFNIQNIPLPSTSTSSPTNSRPSSSSSAALRRQLTTPTPATTHTSLTTSPIPSNQPFPPRTPPSLGSDPFLGTISDPHNRTWSAKSAGASASGTDGSPTPSGLGLAGPKTKHVDISPRKQAWVDGMLRQARRTSSGGTDTPGSAKGTKGGVRRVFLGRNSGKKI